MGALSSALARLQANRPLRELREVAKGVSKQLPMSMQKATEKIDEYARGLISGSGSTLFEELGLYYIGPVDGHNIQDMIDVLRGTKGEGWQCTGALQARYVGETASAHSCRTLPKCCLLVMLATLYLLACWRKQDLVQGGGT